MQKDLSNIKTRQIAPVDLNSFVCMNARLLSEMFGRLGDQIKADSYLNIYLEWKETMEQVYDPYDIMQYKNNVHIIEIFI